MNMMRMFVIWAAIVFLMAAVWWYVTPRSVPVYNGCSEQVTPYIEHHEHGEYKITMCENFGRDTITLKSDPLFLPGDVAAFFYIGYPNDSNISFFFEDSRGTRYPIERLRDSHSRWRRASVYIPDLLEGHVRLVVEDRSVSDYGWAGVGQLTRYVSSEYLKYGRYVETLGWACLFGFLFAVWFGSFLTKADEVDAYIKTALVFGGVSWLAFFVYWMSPWAGKVFSFLFGGITLYRFFLIPGKRRRTVFYMWLWTVLLIVMMMALAYSGSDPAEHIQKLSSNKWFYLPIDNWLPKLFADGILRGNVPSPLVPGWLASDRPPLQTGWFLLVSPLSTDGLWYLTGTVGLQLLVLGFLVLMLRRFVRDRRYLYVTMLVVVFNPTVFVNGLFVWPKLFSALYQAIALYFVLRIWEGERSLHVFVMFGFASALAFVSHGGSVFYLLALGIIVLFLLRSWKEIGKLALAVGTALTVYLPWVFYQKFVDPPGDRLLKLHLAGVWPKTPKSAWEVIKDYYEHLSWERWLAVRWRNLKEIFDSLYVHFSEIWHWDRAQWYRMIFYHTDFSYLMFTTALLVLTPLVYRKFSSEQKRWFLALVASFGLYLLLWNVLLVSATIIHQGAYFGWFSGMLAVTLVVYRWSQLLFYGMATINIGLFFYLYVLPYLSNRDVVANVAFLAAVAGTAAILYVMTIPEFDKEKRCLK